MSKDGEKTNIFLKGLLIGGIVGSALAMLYTPMSGKKLRRKISDRAGDLVDDIDDYVEKGKEKADEIKKKADSIIDEAKKIVTN